jgi:hypothetical protein
MTTNPPFVKSQGGQRTLDGTDGAGGPFGSGIFPDNPTASFGVPKFSFTPGAATPYSWQFNVLVDQELWKDTVLEVGYIGNRARHQLTNYDVNLTPQQSRLAAAFAPTTGAVNALRPFSNYGQIYEFARKGRANYDSLQAGEKYPRRRCLHVFAVESRLRVNRLVRHQQSMGVAGCKQS